LALTGTVAPGLCRFAILAVISSSLMSLPEIGVGQSQIAPPVPDQSRSIPAGPNNIVTVAITKLVEFGGTEIDGKVVNTNNKGDFYAVVTINGVTQNSFNQHIDGGPWCNNFPLGCNIGPRLHDPISQYGPDKLWQFTQAVPATGSHPSYEPVGLAAKPAG
jgi:hypothetical protein